MHIFVPDELKGQEHRIKRFFDAMMYKLRKNSHKSGFDEADISFCMQRLSDEIVELKQAIIDGNSIEIVLEGADVANFALIAAIAAIERGETTDDD